ncbi:MAG: S1 RNA-binding domain-containing protein [Oscillospiraceae bacterium]|nr:S1 RNA-binding domain-containing protein [Oscillospiraceae bacterium]
MSVFYPEGFLFSRAENRAALTSITALREAMLKETVLEARAIKCDKEHNLHIDLGCMEGIIPREEGAVGILDGSVRDIALISRVGKSVQFTVTDIKRSPEGKYEAILSRRRAQEKCAEEYLSSLVPGDVINAVAAHIESFAVFCDIGAGVNALLPIDSISVSRIPHPSARFFTSQPIKAVVKSRDEKGRIVLTHKELLGTWSENAALFTPGETVPGIIRSVESYGIFVELTPNLAGLAEYGDNFEEGSRCAVFIKNIIPERMKIKLIIVEAGLERAAPKQEKYFFTGSHMDIFRYSPDESGKVIETRFI